MCRCVYREGVCVYFGGRCTGLGCNTPPPASRHFTSQMSLSSLFYSPCCLRLFFKLDLIIVETSVPSESPYLFISIH